MQILNTIKFISGSWFLSLSHSCNIFYYKESSDNLALPRLSSWIKIVYDMKKTNNSYLLYSLKALEFLLTILITWNLNWSLKFG